MMRKNLSFILLLLLITACNSKKELVKGERRPIFTSAAEEIMVGDDTSPVEIPNPDTYGDFYGPHSYINKDIENFAVGVDLTDGKFYTKRMGHKQLWEKRRIFSPVVVDGKIYTVNTRGILYVREFGGSNKKILRRRVIKAKDVARSTAPKVAYAGGNIIISTGVNKIISASAEDGSINWERSLNTIPISFPVVHNGVVYVISQDNRLYALDEGDGTIRWIHQGIAKTTTLQGSASPVIYGGYVMAAYSSGEVYIVDSRNGEAVWQENLSGSRFMVNNSDLTDVDATPIIHGDTLYLSSNANKIMAINMTTMQTIWERNIGTPIDMWVAGNALYMVNNDAVLINFDTENGKIRWTKQLPRYKYPDEKRGYIGYRNISMFNDELLILDTLNRFTIASPENGEIRAVRNINRKVFDQPISVDSDLVFMAYEWNGNYMVRTRSNNE